MYKYTSALTISACLGTTAPSADLPAEIASVTVSLDETDNTAGKILGKVLPYIILKVGSNKGIAIEFNSEITDNIDDEPVAISGRKANVSEIFKAIEDKCKLKHDYDVNRKTLVFYKK